MSGDFGRSWTDATPLLTNVTLFNANATVWWPRAGIYQLYTNSAKTRAYAVGVNGRYWTTADGLNWVARKYVEPFRNEGTYFEWFEPNPTLPDNVVAVVATECTYHGNSSCLTSRWDVIISNDGAATWTRLDSFVAFTYLFNFGGPLQLMSLIDGTTDTMFLDSTTIWYLAFGDSVRRAYPGIAAEGDAAKGFGDQRAAWLHWGSQTAGVSDAAQLYVASAITSATPTSVQARSNVRSSSYDGAFIFALEDFNVNVAGSRGSPRNDLFISDDKARTFSTMEMPPPPELTAVPFTSPYDQITFFSIPEDKTFFLILRNLFPLRNGDWYDGDLWVSNGANAGQFTWSLPLLFEGQIYDVKSSGSVLIANKYIVRASGDERVETVISFNQGGSWANIPAPASHTYNCIGSVSVCRLHLRIGSDSIHSEASAPGFIVANGNVGAQLDLNAQSVFVSLDGGVSWRQVIDEFDQREPASIFDIANDGSMFLSVPRGVNTSLISYSAVGGLVWTHCELVDAIAPRTMFSTISPTQNSALLFSNTGGARTVTHVNYNVVFTANCTDNDYEPWGATLPGGGCVLGRNTTYNRIKVGVACLNATKAGQVLSSIPCTCAKNDFVCAQCFFWNSTSQDCGFSAVCPDTTNLPQLPPADCFAPSTWAAPYTGYQKLGDSQCINGLYDPTAGERTLNCPIAAPAPPAQTPAEADKAKEVPRFITPNDVAGIVVGVVIGILLILLVVFVVIIIRRRMANNNPAARLPEPEGGEVAL